MIINPSNANEFKITGIPLMAWMTIEQTTAPIAVLVRSFIRPAPVSIDEAIGENKTSDHATDSKKKSAIILMVSTDAILIA